MIRRFLITILSVIVLSSAACSSGGGSPAGTTKLPAPLSEQYAIDGVVDFSTLPTVTHKTINILDSLGTGSIVSATTLTWAIMNDELNLYVALEWTDNTQNAYDPAVGLTDFDGIAIQFDNNGDGVFAANEDGHRLIMNKYSSSYADFHAVASGDDTDTIGDGRGRMTWSNGVYQAEFLIPLVQDAGGQDGVLNANSRYNINIFDHIQLSVPSGNAGSLAGGVGSTAGTDSSAWPRLPYAAPAAHDQPQIPAGLTGLIAFISDHENPHGELYTFNPASGVVTRVTNSTGLLYLDGISLSHDRTRIAFYGSASPADYTTWEIYTVNTDGTGLRSLTSNSILDGHPAWSPDDSEIIYASFRNGWIASLVVMSSGTGSELRTLTPSGANDNDPEWLPDGRVVFKTDRFGTPGSPQVKIAVMNADGTNVRQLTSVAGTSDHDPMGTNDTVVFERFTKGTDYSTDPSTPYSAWNIVEARVDGGGERTLLADGWVNWLPVYDPSAQYLVYLKNVGYTDARLMTRDGRDLGRLIPGITRMRYIDWK
ncbi:MAG TPA: hypothetical protein VK654_13190 [Nitrospirota bacterium]|nr:hypothetical protein [Nitrospirota bacterium]